jgi:hypothetical protein
VCALLGTPPAERPDQEETARQASVSRQVFQYHLKMVRRTGQAELLTPVPVPVPLHVGPHLKGKPGPRPAVEKTYYSTGVTFDVYKEAAKVASKAVAAKELTLSQAAAAALQSGVKLSRSCIAVQAAKLTIALIQQAQVGGDINKLTIALISSLIFQQTGRVNGTSKPDLIAEYMNSISVLELDACASI